MRRLGLAMAVVVLGSAAHGDEASRAREAIAALEPGQSVTIGELTATMHQKGAGRPDEGGWYPAEAIMTGFRVLLPVPFSETSIVMPTKDGASFLANTVGGRSAEGVGFGAVCAGRSDGRIDIDVAQIVEAVAGTEPSAKSRDVARDGFRGQELKMKTAAGGYLMARYFVRDGWQCQLLVEYPASEAGAIDPIAQTFLDSFRGPTRFPDRAMTAGTGRDEPTDEVPGGRR
jgi:hypothetical protein